MTGPTGHSPIGFSSLALVRRCQGSVAMSHPFQDREETEAQKAGHAAHWVAYELLRGYPRLEGTVAPNGVVVTDEMVEGAELYAEVVDALRAPIEYIEQPLSAPRIHGLCFGTPDYLGYDPATGVIRAIDYKFGHRHVEVFENEQLTAATEAIIDAHGIDDQATMVEFIVVQPRCYHPEGPVRRWSTRAANLRSLINELTAAAAKAMAPNAPCATGSHCVDCKGREACEALNRVGGIALDLVSPLECLVQTPADVGRQLRIIDQAIERLEAIRTARVEQALQFIRSGQRVPFYTQDFTKPRDIWSVPVDEVKALGQMLGVELVTEKPCTPKQAMGELKKKGVDGSVIKAYSSTPPGALKLVPDTTTKASKIFGVTQ